MNVIHLTLRGLIGACAGDPLSPRILAGDVAKVLADNPDAPLSVDLDCDGGFLGEAWRLHDAISAHRGPTTARVRRHCDSAGVVILAAFDTRLCSPWSSFLLHSVRVQQPDFGPELYTARDLRRLALVMDEDEAAMSRLLSERTKKRGVYWRDRFLPDPGWLMCADEAFETGLVHEVMP